MNPVKEVIVSDLHERLKGSPYILVVDYKKTTVPEFSEARKRLREVGARLTVARNSFIRLAASRAGIPDDLAKTLLGQNAFVTGGSDAATAAKVLRQFSNESKKLELKGGVVDGSFIDDAGARRLADLPSKAQLQAQLLGVLLAPATRLVRTLNEPAAALARVLQAKADASKAA
jgi:large subunit ribosomal protein L10